MYGFGMPCPDSKKIFLLEETRRRKEIIPYFEFRRLPQPT